MTDGDYATRSEVAVLRRRVVALERAVGQIRQRRPADGRLGAILAAIKAFASSSAWTCGELVVDARRAAPELWMLLDAVSGGRGDLAVRLGIFFKRQEGVAVDGLILERVQRELGVWTYRVKALKKHLPSDCS
jgi:hypothetical protein